MLPVEVTILKSTTTSNVIRCLEKFFATHGLPECIRSDNGPQFRSQEFAKFLADLSIKHVKGIPYWPPSNGEVENHNQTLLKAIRIAKIEKKDYKREVERFLFAYRTTPHCTTGVSPAELMFGRRLRTKLPSATQIEGWATDHDPQLQTERLSRMRATDAAQKDTYRQYADKHRRAQVQDLEPGDQVLLKYQQRQNKLTPTYEERPYEVLQKKGSAVTIRDGDGMVKMRNAGHVKKYQQVPYHLQYQPVTPPRIEPERDVQSGEPVPEVRPPPDPPDVTPCSPVKEPATRVPRTKRVPARFDSYELY